jgi:hypothetical protein
MGGFYPDSLAGPQEPADVAVVTNTVIRPVLERALESVFAQDFQGRIQLALGVDVARGDPGLIDQVLARRPAHVSALVLQPPYSTSMRHGGVHTPYDGGALRALLSLACNARYVAYLDDDNDWRADHLRLLHAAVQGKAWAFSQRMLVDEDTDEDLGLDIWDNMGPQQGRMARWGGFADTNCLMVDKRRLAHVFGAWAQTADLEPGFLADRRFFLGIAPHEHARVEAPTVRYRIRKTNVLHHYLKAGSNDPEVMQRLEAMLAQTRRPRTGHQFADGAGGS